MQMARIHHRRGHCRSWPGCRGCPLSIPIYFLLFTLLLLLQQSACFPPSLTSGPYSYSEYNAWKASLERSRDASSASDIGNDSAGDQQLKEIEKNLQEMHDDEVSAIDLLFTSKGFPEQAKGKGRQVDPQNEDSISPLFDGSLSRFGSLDDIIASLGVDDENITTLEILEGPTISSKFTKSSMKNSSESVTILSPTSSPSPEELSPQKILSAPEHVARLSHNPLPTLKQSHDYNVTFSMQQTPSSPTLGVMVSPSYVLPQELQRENVDPEATGNINSIQPTSDSNNISVKVASPFNTQQEDKYIENQLPTTVAIQNSQLKNEKFAQLKSQLLSPLISHILQNSPIATSSNLTSFSTHSQPPRNEEENVKRKTFARREKKRLPPFRDLIRSRRARSTFKEVIGIDGSRRYVIEGEDPQEGKGNARSWETIDVSALGIASGGSRNPVNVIDRTSRNLMGPSAAIQNRFALWEQLHPRTNPSWQMLQQQRAPPYAQPATPNWNKPPNLLQQYLTGPGPARPSLAHTSAVLPKTTAYTTASLRGVPEQLQVPKSDQLGMIYSSQGMPINGQQNYDNVYQRIGSLSAGIGSVKSQREEKFPIQTQFPVQDHNRGQVLSASQFSGSQQLRFQDLRVVAAQSPFREGISTHSQSIPPYFQTSPLLQPPQAQPPPLQVPVHKLPLPVSFQSKEIHSSLTGAPQEQFTQQSLQMPFQTPLPRLQSQIQTETPYAEILSRVQRPQIQSSVSQQFRQGPTSFQMQIPSLQSPSQMRQQFYTQPSLASSSSTQMHPPGIQIPFQTQSPQVQQSYQNQPQSLRMQTPFQNHPQSHHLQTPFQNHAQSRQVPTLFPNQPQSLRVQTPFENQPLQGPNSFQNQPLQGPNSFQNQPLQGPNSFQNQPLQGTNSFQNQPLQGPNSFQNQPLQGPNSFQNQPLQGPNSFQNQPLQGPNSFQNQPLQGPNSFQNQPLQGPNSFQNQPLQGPNSFQNQPHRLKSSFQNQPPLVQTPFQNQPPRVPTSFQNSQSRNQSPFQNLPFRNQSPQGLIPFQNQPPQLQSPFQNQPLRIQSPLPNQLPQGPIPFQNLPSRNQSPFLNQPPQVQTPFPNQQVQVSVPFPNQSPHIPTPFLNQSPAQIQRSHFGSQMQEQNPIIQNSYHGQQTQHNTQFQMLHPLTEKVHLLPQLLQTQGANVTPKQSYKSVPSITITDSKLMPMPPLATPVNQFMTVSRGEPTMSVDGRSTTYTTLRSSTNYPRPPSQPTLLAGTGQVVRQSAPFPQQYQVYNKIIPEQKFHMSSNYPFTFAKGPGPVRGRGRPTAEPYPIPQKYPVGTDATQFFGRQAGNWNQTFLHDEEQPGVRFPPDFRHSEQQQPPIKQPTQSPFDQRPSGPGMETKNKQQQHFAGGPYKFQSYPHSAPSQQSSSDSSKDTSDPPHPPTRTHIPGFTSTYQEAHSGREGAIAAVVPHQQLYGKPMDNQPNGRHGFKESDLFGPKSSGTQSSNIQLIGRGTGFKEPEAIGIGGTGGFAVPIVDGAVSRSQFQPQSQSSVGSQSTGEHVEPIGDGLKAGQSQHFPRPSNGRNNSIISTQGFRNNSSGRPTGGQNNYGGDAPNIVTTSQVNSQEHETSRVSSSSNSSPQASNSRKQLPHHGGDLPFYSQSEVNAHHQRLLANTQTAQDSEFENDAAILSWYLQRAKAELRHKQEPADNQQHGNDSQASTGKVGERPTHDLTNLFNPTVQQGHISPAQLAVSASHSSDTSTLRAATTQLYTSPVPHSSPTTHDRGLFTIPPASPMVQTTPNTETVHGSASTNGLQSVPNSNGLSPLQRTPASSSASSPISPATPTSNVHSIGAHPGRSSPSKAGMGKEDSGAQQGEAHFQL